MATALLALGACTTQNNDEKSQVKTDNGQAAIENIMTRTSIRQFKAQPVEQDKVDILLKAAMAAPSALNLQPWHFIVINDKETIALLSGKRPTNAPLMIAVCGDTDKTMLPDGSTKLPDFWVEDVSVKRLLPDRFVIKIRERMPSFWVRHDDRLYYANDRGEIIAQVESDNFMSLPMLTIEPGGEDAIPYLSRLMKDMRSGALPIEVGAIATVDVSPSKGVEIYLEDREMRLSLAPDDWEGNLSRLGVAIGDLARRRELGMVQEARAADGSVWVSLRQQLR